VFDPCVEMGFSCFGFIWFCLLYLQIVYTFQSMHLGFVIKCRRRG